MKTKYFILTYMMILSASFINAQPKYTMPDTAVKGLDSTKVAKAKELVTNYVKIMIKGEPLDSLRNICGLPFSWDRKKIIDNWTGFMAEHQSIIDKKGKNMTVKIDTVIIKASRYEMLDKLIPLNYYYLQVKISSPSFSSGKPQGIMFAVLIAEEMRIVGFSD